MVDNLCDFAKAGSWTQILDNCKRPSQVMVADIIVNKPTLLPAKSLMRLNVAKVVEYYLDIGRALPASGMLWANCLCNFKAKKESLDRIKDNNSNLKLPVISNNLKIFDWFEAFDTFCNGYIGQSGTPLTLVSRPLVIVPVVAPPLVADQPCSTE